MNPFATRFSFKTASHKANWVLFIAENVIESRALVAAEALSTYPRLSMQVKVAV